MVNFHFMCHWCRFVTKTSSNPIRKSSWVKWDFVSSASWTKPIRVRQPSWGWKRPPRKHLPMLVSLIFYSFMISPHLRRCQCRWPRKANPGTERSDRVTLDSSGIVPRNGHSTSEGLVLSCHEDERRNKLYYRIHWTLTGCILYGPPGTGKTLLAKAVANSTNATFMRVTGSELVKKTLGDGPKLVREIFKIAAENAPTIIFIDEVDAIGGKRNDGKASDGEKEVQRTLLELLNQLDGFDKNTDVRIIMATNRIDCLDPALIRPGRIDRKIEVPLPSDNVRFYVYICNSFSPVINQLFLTVSESNLPTSHQRNESCWGCHFRETATERCGWTEVSCSFLVSIFSNLFDSFQLISTSSGADISAMTSAAGMLALRERRKVITLKDFEEAKKSVLYRKKMTTREGLYV